jgi:hypothetical protein
MVVCEFQDDTWPIDQRTRGFELKFRQVAEGA